MIDSTTIILLGFFALLSILAILFIPKLRKTSLSSSKLKSIIDNQHKELSDKNKNLLDQTESLNEINTLLEERQQALQEQADRLKKQSKELNDLNKELSDANALKDKFLSIIAHDLKNPFNVVMGLSELLKSKALTLDKGRLEQYTNEIYESSSQIYTLLENLLDWSRSQRKRIKLEPSRFPLIELVNENLSLAKELIEKKSIGINIEVSDDLMIYIDKNTINTVVRNLLTNAIKYTPENGIIYIRAKEISRDVIIEMEDTGVGMSKEQLKSIFSINKVKSTKGTLGEGGTGLGLVLCKEFTELNNGRLTVNSEEGKGSVFTIYLPQSY